MHWVRSKAKRRVHAVDAVMLSLAMGVLFVRCAQSQSEILVATDFMGPQLLQKYVYLGELGQRIEATAIERLGPNSIRVQEQLTVLIEGKPQRSTGTYILSANQGEIRRHVAEREEILLKEPLTLAGANWSAQLENHQVGVDPSGVLRLECKLSSVGRTLVLGEERTTLTVTCVGETDAARGKVVEYRYGRPQVVVTRWFAESIGLIREELMIQDESGLDVTTERLLHEISESSHESDATELPAGDLEAAAFEAIMSGDANRLRKLIEAGAEVNARNEVGYTPLMGAASMNRVDMLEELLEAGADLNATTPEGATALIVASIQQSAEAVKFLVGSGADLAPRVFTDLYPGKTALEIARENRNEEIEATLSRSRE